MVIAFKYDIMNKKISQDETDKGLSLGSKPDWSPKGIFIISVLSQADRRLRHNTLLP